MNVQRHPIAALGAAAALSLGTIAALGADVTPPSPVPIPVPTPVNDPLLAPVPPAPHVLRSWREAVTLIGARSPDVAIAREEVQRAEGQRRIALAQALPSLTGTGSLTHNLLQGPVTVSGGVAGAGIPIVAPTPVAVAQLVAVQPILAPRAWYGLRTAALATTTTKLTLEDRERTVFTSVADAIITVYTAERLAEINRVQLRGALDLVSLTNRRFQLGAAPRLDVVRVEQNAALTRTTLINGDESLRRDREALGLLLGFSDAVGVPPTLSLNDIDQTARSVCSPGVVAERPDVLAAQSNLHVARRGITDVELSFAPTAIAQSTAAVSNQLLGTQRHESWTIQALLTVPFFEGGARYGNLRIARAVAVEAQVQLDATVRAATQAAAQAYRGVIVAEQARVVSEQSRDLAREVARLAQLAFMAGTGTSLDLVDATQRARTAELDLAVSEFNVTRARLLAILTVSRCRY